MRAGPLALAATLSLAFSAMADTTPSAVHDTAPDAARIAQAPADSGEAWDASHMRTLYRSVLSHRIPPTRIDGRDRFHQLETSSAPAPPQAVEEALLPAASQHPWARTGTRSAASTPGWSTRDRIQSRGRGFGSAGGRVGSRGSSLRSASVSRSR